jgi:hypothetical protein
MRSTRSVISIVAAAAVLLLASCTTINNLDRYKVEGSTLAADMPVPPPPRLDIDYSVHIDSRNPLGTVLSIGTNIIKASEAEKAEANMRQALDTVDVPGIVLKETAQSCARALDARLVAREDRADYLLDLDIREYGIEAPSWGSAVSLHLRMVVTMYSTRGRDIVWRRAVTVDDPANPQMFGVGQVMGDIVTAGVLSSLTVEQLEEGFRQLARESARSVGRRLEKDFYRANWD